MRLLWQWLCVAGLAVSALAVDTPPSIVLITLDTTRADRMGFLGSARGLTPNLDALARQSAIFTRAYSQVPLTSASHATILTGTYPQFHQVLDFPMPLPKTVPYAPEILHARGYKTAAFIGSLALDPTAGAPGFDRGFDIYDAGFQSKGIQNKSRYQTVERRGGEVVARALAWLDKHPKGPYFLWVHLYDAHDPYDPPEPYKTRYAAEPYDGEIAYADSAVGKLLRQLKARGIYDQSVIAVMADHGESLGAHGEDTHGIFLYDETIHVPLLIKLPRESGRGNQKRIENRVELVDVLPTLLQAVGAEIPHEVQGESLLELMTPTSTKPGAPKTDGPDAWRDRAAYAESDYPFLAYGWNALQSLRTGKYLYIQAPHRELYDQTADAKAEHNLASASVAVADTLSSRAETFRQKTSSKVEAPAMMVDMSTRDKLAALGYVASSNASKAGPFGQGPDPKDKIETANVIRRVNTLFENGRFDQAIPILQELIVKEPSMAIVYAKLGGSYMKLHEYDKAVPVLRRAVEFDPGLNMAQLDLGRSLLRTGDLNGAAAVFEGLVARIPNLLDAHLFLEITYARQNRVPETIKECEAVLKFLPDQYGSTLLLGQFLLRSGDAEAALLKLQRAAEIRPQAPQPHMSLADTYAKLGRQADAERERSEAMRLRSNPQDLAPDGIPSNAAPQE
ncbi:MAG TPA: sulfatase-like hydrolase/transferase [Terriglobales bacterium]|jgi:arylsulfatase A-like enzyme/Flp pilus assembly protein TadD|nr:sulfatase-like hydrolase/transferase [Terriglobales bacterium]